MVKSRAAGKNLPLSSSGLGRGPLKAETGVRVPVGAPLVFHHEPRFGEDGRFVVKIYCMYFQEGRMSASSSVMGISARRPSGTEPIAMLRSMPAAYAAKNP